MSAAHAASAPAGFAGVGNWSWPTDTQSAQLGAAGVGSFRANLSWDWVEHTQGVRQWGGVDALMSQASTNNYELVLVLNGCVAWACGGNTRTQPVGAGLTAYQDFVSDAARRYGAGGSFWAAHPNLTPVKVDWQVWNEVNVGVDWPNPTSAAYEQFLQTISGSIKTVDPSATVVSAGLAENAAVASGQSMAQFLTGLEQTPGFQTSADVVAVHGYANDPAGTIRILDTAKAIMRAAGDNRPIWVTELGWGDGPTPDAFNVGAANVAAYLRTTYDTMVACRARWGLTRAMWFSLNDVSASALGEPDYWGMHTGLFDVNGNAKAAWTAFQDFTGGHTMQDAAASSCSLPGGDDPAATVNPTGVGSTAVPHITIVQSPQYVGQTTASPKVDFVTDMGNSGHAECSLNGGAFTVCSTPYAISKTAGQGTTTLAVRAVNAYGIAGPAVSTSWSVDLTPPQTVFTKTPRKVVRHNISARFGVRATCLAVGQAAVASYQCSLNGSPWKTCSAKYRAKPKKAGAGTLRVRAVDKAGNIDPTGATAHFVVAKLHKNAKI